jgi:hypothetical protein
MDWLNKFYIYVHSKIDNVNFYKSFMVYLAANHFIKEKQLKASISSGRAL